MPNSKDKKTIRKVFRKFIRKKKRSKYRVEPEIFPEIEVRNFLNIIDKDISCCDGLAERTQRSRMKITKNDYGLLELKGKNFDTRHNDIGQFQMNQTILHFKPFMNPYKGYSFIKEGGWLAKKGYEVKKGKLYKKVGGPEEKLINNLPLRIYYYDNRYNVYRR